MANHKVEVCCKGNIEELMSFLAEAWNKEHMLATNKAFVDYAFFDERTEQYNILFARNTVTAEIEGFIAYVTTGFFDENITEDFCWITNWLVKEGADGSLGILLYMSGIKRSACKYYGTVGQNRTAEQLYEKMKYKIGELNQYFIVNNSIEETKIISGYGNKKEATHTQKRFNDAPNLSCMSNGAFPQKTEAYIRNKYLKSPYYEYKIYGNEGCAFIFKKVTHNNTSCLRIVEFFGDTAFLKSKRAEFQNLLMDFCAEYLDFYCYGIDEEILTSSGFEKNSGQYTIPNYFEPFLNENIRIAFAYNKDVENLRIFKGDCDREHPRKL